MNKLILVLTASVCGIAVGVAATFWSDLQRERNKANTLAERVAVLEPVERADPSQMSNKPMSAASPPRVEFVAAPPREAAERPEPPLKGSPRALQQVARLQAALVHGTPLLDYQAQALVAAIDRFPPSDRVDAESRTRLRQAAADILFESQFETYVELFEPQGPSRPP